MHWSRQHLLRQRGVRVRPARLQRRLPRRGQRCLANGKHGFIFSRGCMRNVMRNNIAFDNAGHGFMIDDGRSADRPRRPRPASTPRTTTSSPATSPTTTPAAASRSRAAPATRSSDNRLSRNDVGVRIKYGATATVTDNAIVGSARYGVNVLGGPAAYRSAATPSAVPGRRSTWPPTTAPRWATTPSPRSPRRWSSAASPPARSRRGEGRPDRALEPDAGAVDADPRAAGAGRADADRARAAPSIATTGGDGMTGPLARGVPWTLVLLTGLVLLLTGAPPRPARMRRETVHPLGHRRAPGWPGRPTCPRPTRFTARRPPSR